MAKTIVLREFSGVQSAPTEEVPYDEALRACLTAKTASLDSGDLVSAGYAAKGAAECYRRLGLLRHARIECDAAVKAFQRADDSRGLGWALFASGNLLRQQSDFIGAYRSLSHALTIAQITRTPGLGAYALAGIAETTRIVGDYKHAHRQHLAAYRVFRAAGDVRGEVWALEGVGQILRNCGRPNLARRHFDKAKRLAVAGNDARGLAYAVKCHGECLAELGHFESGAEEVSAAVTLFAHLGFQVGLGYSLKALGDVRLRRGDLDSAAKAYMAAVSVFQPMDDARGLAYATNGLAAVQSRRGGGAQAAQLYIATHAYFAEAGVQFGVAKSRAGIRHLRAVGLITAPQLKAIIDAGPQRGRTICWSGANESPYAVA